MDAALAVINREGHGGLSVDAVAKEAGVTRPVVYGAFEGGLGELVTALLDRQQVRIFGRFLEAMPESYDEADPIGFVTLAIERLVTMLHEDPDTWRPILHPPDGMPATVRERIEADRERVRVMFASLISDIGRSRPDWKVDAELYSHAVLAIVEHFGRVMIDDPDRFTAERLLAGARAVLGTLWRQ